MGQALDDITVLDLGRVIAMPFCTMLLADASACYVHSMRTSRVRHGEDHRYPPETLRNPGAHRALGAASRRTQQSRVHRALRTLTRGAHPLAG